MKKYTYTAPSMEVTRFCEEEPLQMEHGSGLNGVSAANDNEGSWNQSWTDRLHLG